MAVVRIGVVADTHCPEFLERLPEQVFQALAGADLILHAGDVNGAGTLEALARIGPVRAVRGDHDHAMPDLPDHLEVEVEGRRIVLVHGNRSRWREEPQTFLWTISLGHYRPHRSLAAALRRRFPSADVLVHGHTHRSLIDRAGGPGGQLVFNPGGVFQWTPVTAAARLRRHPGWFEWCWLQVARHIRSHPLPTVGILEITPSGIEPRIVEL